MILCTDLTEPYPDLQVAVATLSTGPVGPGDAINKTSREVLMRSVVSHNKNTVLVSLCIIAFYDILS